MNSRPKACLECGVQIEESGPRIHKGRGLCARCHGYARNHGTLDQWPLFTRRGQWPDLIEDMTWLAATGESVDRWRDRLGYTGTVESMARLLRKHGRHDLARKLWPVVYRERSAA